MKQLLGAVLGCLLLASACGDDGGESAGPTSTTRESTESTTSTELAPTTAPEPEFTEEEQAVIDAYLEFWEVRIEVLDPPDPTDPRIAEVATGGGLEAFIEQIERDKRDGIGTRLPEDTQYEHEIRTVTVGNDTAEVSSCEFDDTELYDVETGETITDGLLVSHLRAELRRLDDTWRIVSTEAIQEISSPEASCDDV